MMDNSNKRRRTATSSNGEEIRHITHLPDALLVNIASYLERPSTVLFAIAMKYQSTTEASNAIISNADYNGWNVLDFGDIEKSLAANLTDDHIDAILRSINAVNNLKILKLAGCTKITGSGLEVLQSSTALERIDLSLVGKHEPAWENWDYSQLSETVVIPFLDDIISNRRTLKSLEFPKKWRVIQSTQIDQFLRRYNNYLINQRFSCSKCGQDLLDEPWVNLQRTNPDHGGEADWYGTQSNTCSSCLKQFCNEDECADDTWCKKCEKQYCQECTPSTLCGNCDQNVCNKCGEMKACEGEDCEESIVLCEDCYERKTCSYCNRTRCCVETIPCRTDDCQNMICRDCHMVEWRSIGRCSECYYW